MLTRRDVFAGSAAVLAVGSTPVLAAVPDLVAAPAVAQITSNGGPTTPVWAYRGSVPGPVLRIPQGGRVRCLFQNHLPQASTIHWHGIRIENAMDGVAGLTQEAVAVDGTFQYDFTVPDAGTYWYHPHNRTWEQMARGLYGALIVEEPSPPQVDHDLPLMIDDWRLAEDGSIHDSFGQMHDWSHAGRLGNWITVNGNPDWRQNVRRNDRLRLRLINAANARIFQLGAKGLSGWVVALDGQPLDRPEPLEEVTLAPSQRADLIVDVDADADEVLLYSRERDAAYLIASFPVTGSGRAEVLPMPAPLAPNPVPALTDLSTADVVDLRMDGGAMGQMTHATLKGQKLGVRDLVSAGMAWSFNGQAGMPGAALVTTAMNRPVRLRIENATRWPHAIHLHGHHFREVKPDQSFGPLRDTLLFHGGETREIAFMADNPGQWLLHCHMLEHAAAGMMTWIDVTA